MDEAVVIHEFRPSFRKFRRYPTVDRFTPVVGAEQDTSKQTQNDHCASGAESVWEIARWVSKETVQQILEGANRLVGVDTHSATALRAVFRQLCSSPPPADLSRASADRACLVYMRKAVAESRFKNS